MSPAGLLRQPREEGRSTARAPSPAAGWGGGCCHPARRSRHPPPGLSGWALSGSGGGGNLRPSPRAARAASSRVGRGRPPRARRSPAHSASAVSSPPPRAQNAISTPPPPTRAFPAPRPARRGVGSHFLSQGSPKPGWAVAAPLPPSVPGLRLPASLGGPGSQGQVGLGHQRSG